MGKYKKICNYELDKVKTGPGDVAILAIITAILAVAVLGIVGTAIKEAPEPITVPDVIWASLKMTLKALPLFVLFIGVFYSIAARNRIVMKKLRKALQSVDISSEAEIDDILENMTAVDEEIFVGSDFAFNFAKPIAVRFSDVESVRLTHSPGVAYYDIRFITYDGAKIHFMVCNDRALFDKMQELFEKYVPNKVAVIEKSLPQL